MARLLQTVAISLVLLGASAGMGCSARSLDYEEDFTEAVERICVNFCEVNLACREPQWFQSYEECEQNCLHSAYIYNDTVCGQAKRDLYECIGSTSTCELYNDTLNVQADEYTCQVQNEHRSSLALGGSCDNEDPYPLGAP